MLIETEKSNLLRDTNSKALISTNKKRREEMKLARDRQREINRIKERMDKMENNISEILRILKNREQI